jgi:UDPglucose--hexose-1-phosphate uridylyltransferase
MSELRHDALTGRLVLLAPTRSARPHTAADPGTRGVEGADCPFCPGNEHDTPPEVARTGPGGPETPGWRVRVVPNLYPIVGGPDAGVGTTGAHEVAVLSPDHGRSFADLTHDEAAEVLTVLRDRAAFHLAAGRSYVQILVNHGRGAGASIAHPHAQLLALDFVPPAVTVAAERFATLGADLVRADLDEAVSLDLGVVVGDEIVAWCPAASAAPFELRIAARGAGPNFDAAADGDVLGVAVVLRDVVAALRAVAGDLPYNVVVHTAGHVEHYHWWLEVVPRNGVVAGFELGTGVLVNTIDPRDAAAKLRDALRS